MITTMTMFLIWVGFVSLIPIAIYIAYKSDNYDNCLAFQLCLILGSLGALITGVLTASMFLIDHVYIQEMSVI